MERGLIAGLLITERYNKYKINPDNNKRLEYYGSGFVAKKHNNQYHIHNLKTRTHNDNFDSCSDDLFKIYCRKRNIEKEGYNMNDIRF